MAQLNQALKIIISIFKAAVKLPALSQDFSGQVAPIGNRIQRITNKLTSSDAETQTLTYASDSNRLATLNGSKLPVDAAGNHTQVNNLRITYGNQGRMSEVY